MRRAGYWVSDKKCRKLNFAKFALMCREVQIDLVKIDLHRPLQEQGPFDVILHKVTDIVADVGQDAGQEYMERFQKYFNEHPEMVVIDPIDKVQKVLDRYEQYKIIQECHLAEEDAKVFSPNFVELTTRDVETNKRLIEKAGVKYPFVCKPTSAHGSNLAHQMAIIFNDKGLGDVSPPCVVQNFVNHHAVLYKIFVIGEEHSVVERPSLKNFKPGDKKTIFFDSHFVSKATSSSFLNELDDSDSEHTPGTPNSFTFSKLVKSIQSKLCLDLFGMDVIIENETHRYAVIDINAFPGYDGVDNFFQTLLDRIVQRLELKTEELTATTTSNIQFSQSTVVEDNGEASIDEVRGQKLRIVAPLCDSKRYLEDVETGACHSFEKEPQTHNKTACGT